MANAKANFKKAVVKAKKLYKSGRYKTFADAVKAAYKTIGGTKKAHRQTGASVAKRDKARKAKPPGKRISKSKRVYYERRKNRSDKPGTLSGHVSAIKNLSAQRIAMSEFQKFKATTKADKRKIAKKIAEYKRQYNKLA